MNINVEQWLNRSHLLFLPNTKRQNILFLILNFFFIFFYILKYNPQCQLCFLNIYCPKEQIIGVDNDFFHTH